jgi:hypothetical protein
MFSDWISFLAYPNLFGIKGFVVVVVFTVLQLDIMVNNSETKRFYGTKEIITNARY